MFGAGIFGLFSNFVKNDCESKEIFQIQLPPTGSYTAVQRTTATIQFRPEAFFFVPPSPI